MDYDMNTMITPYKVSEEFMQEHRRLKKQNRFLKKVVKDMIPDSELQNYLAQMEDMC